ncbi:hypothetical protein H4S07_003067, partial [Coemansia furcata]
MTTHPRNPSGVTAVGPDYSILAGENFGFSTVPGAHDSGLYELVQGILRHSCDAVFKLATPSDPTVSVMAVKLADIISTDLEARLSTAALRRGSDNDPRGGMRTSDPLDAWATDILAWTGFPVLVEGADSQRSDDGQCSDDLELMVWEADKLSPCFESFILFVAHHVKAYVGNHVAAGLLKPEDCRLILPVAYQDVGTELSGTNSADYVDPWTLLMSSVACFHLIARDPDFYKLTKLKLATRTKALHFDQHNRRFAWGLAALSRTIHAYIFGADDIWASTTMGISSAKGRHAFISLLVSWSLCSVDSLGFDPTIRYEIDQASGNPYLEIDVQEKDNSTGQVKCCTYYSQRCVGAADRLTGRHARYFAASTTRESMGKPAFLIKDVWTASDDDSAGDARENSFLK